MDLHDENDSYVVMYHHILSMKYSNILAAFDEKRLSGFLDQYLHGPF